jgi:hypothetical protein
MTSVRVDQAAEDRIAAKWRVLYAHLDEDQRRLWLGLEARELGEGGVRIVCQATGAAESTIRRGLAEVESGAAPTGRVRRAGGGRKPVTETQPGIVNQLNALVSPGERGDPERLLRWCTDSTRDLARKLHDYGYEISHTKVAELLAAEGYSLQANVKTLEGASHPDRDGQFRHIDEQAQSFMTTGDPVISVDTKKKENLGEYKNAGTAWRAKGEPTRVKTHDFPDKQLGKAIPYGIYDVANNNGWVSVGSDADTAAFAVNTLRSWWNTAGRKAYPNATRLMVTADCGGSNGNRVRLWKTELAGLAAETGLAITVCHFPPGTSKWNKIEHRLFSHITINWKGCPLTSHEVVLDLIGATTTTTGLTIHAEADTNQYPKGIKISNAELDAVPLQRHEWHGEWNYTVLPVRHAPDPIS